MQKRFVITYTKPPNPPLSSSLSLRTLGKRKRQRNPNKCERDPVLDSEAMVCYREPTMYDNFLASLGLSNKVVTRMKKRRHMEEEGKSDTDMIQGGGQESLGALTRNTEQENHNLYNEEEEGFETDDEEHELCTYGQSSSTSSFREHLSHILSTEEVNTLPKGNWKFKWEAPAIGMPNCTWKGTRPNFLHVAQSDPTYGLKPKLYKHWLQLYEKSGGKDFGSSNRRRFFSICNSYLDIFHSNKKPYYNGGRREDTSQMDAYLMHSLNHIFRTRDLVKKNECKISNLPEEEILSDDGFRDQGFTRPKVLILLPYKSIAFRAVMRLIQLTPESQRVNVEYLDRFNKEFGCDVSTWENEISEKPSDWQALIGDGNDDDVFMIGIKHTKKSIRLYGDFYSSDMIIASPLGIVTAIGKKEDKKEQDVDYLSSIEVLVIDHADVMSMQNWKHVDTAVKQLNRLPSKPHSTNIMRVRPLYLDGHARFYRQSIFISSYLTAEMDSLFNHHCLNYKGKMKLECAYDGVLKEVLCNATQFFERFDATSMVHANDARFEYFTKKVFPRIRDSVQGGVMIFINSYFEYYIIAKYLKSQDASFCFIDEDASTEVKSRARQEFFDGSKQIMLYTERAYFFWGYKVRGIKKLIFYSLPERKEFYPRITNMLEESDDMVSTVLFSRYDVRQLKRIVGNDKGSRLISSESSIVAFR
ncbi:PREDICTED: U3 small nucleolar RNA-associated protein 25-like [Camelina sativa]|uniref:U3 small nucleolar RNA-associated protein 25-like n=1 Tax=Camelina sativa TaxID=90675 RepID=A0ABM0W1U0_CAMSA|nr:PREDICTED: U3 small nucleolar RNA-associated protein 25-like [Camelina sativa]